MHAIPASRDTARSPAEEALGPISRAEGISRDRFHTTEPDYYYEERSVDGAGIVWGVLFGAVIWAVFAMVLLVVF